MCLVNLCFLGEVLLEQPRPHSSSSRHLGLDHGGQEPQATLSWRRIGETQPLPAYLGRECLKSTKILLPPPLQVLCSAKRRVRLAAPVTRPPPPRDRGSNTSQRLHVGAALPVAGFMFIFQLGSTSLIQKIPSSGTRRNFKPTSHSHLFPSSLCSRPGWAAGCSREPAHESLAPFCQSHLGRSQTQAGKADAGEAAQMGRTGGRRKTTADIKDKSPSAKGG